MKKQILDNNYRLKSFGIMNVMTGHFNVPEWSTNLPIHLN